LKSCAEADERPATYVLVVLVKCFEELSIGSLGLRTVEPGVYLYVGSARGFGGLKARLRRHLSRDKKMRWHIDYLTAHPCTEVYGAIALYHEKSVKLESAAAEALRKCRGFAPAIRGFGSTDTEDETHLLKCLDKDKDPGNCLAEALKCVEAYLGIQTKGIEVYRCRA